MRKRLLLFALALASVLGVVACGGNRLPTASAGPDVEALAGDSVELSGESSTDIEGGPLTYRWEIVSQPPGSMVSLINGDTVSPLLETDVPGEYEVGLTVNDGKDDSVPDTVLVSVKHWFTDATEVAGVPGGGAQNYEEGYGSGAAWGDYDDDGDPDLYVTRDGPNLLYRNNGDGTLTEVGAKSGVDSPLNSYGATWGDYDNDGKLDLYVVNHGEDQEGDLEHVAGQANLLYRNNGDGTFTDVAAEAGVDHEAHGIGAIWSDFDNDGWLDIFISNLGVLGHPQGKKEADILLRNNADGTFQEISAEAGISEGAGELVRTDQTRAIPSGLSFGAVWLDYDEDGDSDLFIANESGASPLYRNEGDGTFVDVTKEAGLLVYGRARGAVGGDYDNDGDPDVYVTGYGRNRLWRNNGDLTFTDVADAAGVADSSAGWGAGFIDFDNDGHLDLYVANGASDPGEGARQPNRLYRNNGDSTFADVTRVAGVGGEGMGRGVAFADYDADGDVDIYVANADGDNVLYRNEIGSRMNWLKVRLLGTTSNLGGIGTRVEMTTLDLAVRTAWLSGGSSYLGQNSIELMNFGLGASDQVDVKVTWPSGIVQDFWNVPSNRIHVAKEGILEGSCPMVFAWNGSTYALVSDVLGSAVTGFSLAPGVYRFPIDTDEYLLIEDLKPRDGLYSIQIVEMLNEIIYLDQAKLLVVDHPSDVDVYPNERLKLFPPFPEPGIQVVGEARLPVAAFDDKGNDILPLISERDGIYVDGFEFLPHEGFAEEHSIILDLGDLSGAKNILLLLDGWTHYLTSNALNGASQDGVSPMLPRLEAVDEEGEWVTVTTDMGFPAGQPKTMTFDLTGAFPTDDYRVRITTNLQIFWDRIRVSTYAESPTLRVTELKPAADLHWKGFPVQLAPTGDRQVSPAAYDYNVVEADGDRWVLPKGNYTRYGDVTPLLDRIDDMYVIMRAGDETTIDFSAEALPELLSGWSRSFILYLDGFLKYVDPYVAFASSIEPLPFHSMSSYPYPPEEGYPDDEEHLRYLKEYNTRTVTNGADQKGSVRTESSCRDQVELNTAWVMIFMQPTRSLESTTCL